MTEQVKILCQCGSHISIKNKVQHEKSQKHMIGMQTHEICELNKTQPVNELVKTLSSENFTNLFQKEVLNRLESILEVLGRIEEDVIGLYEDEEDLEKIEEVDEKTEK